MGYLNHFSDLTDGRQAGRVVYPLDEVLLLALLAVLAGADTFTDIARFGEKKLPLLRRFRPFKDGTILDKKADYVLALKGNQGSLREDVAVFVAEQAAKGFADTQATRDTTIDGHHGRIETRTTTVIHDVAPGPSRLAGAQGCHRGRQQPREQRKNRA